jgi:hypothetical protein
MRAAIAAARARPASMGAWGALSNVFAHPDARRGGWPPPHRRDESLSFLGTPDEFRRSIRCRWCRDALGGGLQIWLDVGLDDPWRASATVLHDVLAQRGIEHVWQLYPGGHLWSYWDEHFIDYLRFYGNALSPGRSRSRGLVASWSAGSAVAARFDRWAR